MTSSTQTPGRGIGWVLLVALAIAVSIAISLAVQLSPERASPEPPRCGGLYTECCLEWDDDWGPCSGDECVPRSNFDDDRGDDGDDGDDDQGLFDAEENFTDRRGVPSC